MRCDQLLVPIAASKNSFTSTRGGALACEDVVDVRSHWTAEHTWAVLEGRLEMRQRLVILSYYNLKIIRDVTVQCVLKNLLT
jgi:hypothetical protein